MGGYGILMNIEKKESKKWKSLVSGFFILLILAVMLLLLFKSHSPEELRGLFMRMNATWLIAALGCVLLSYFAEMMSYYELTKKVNGKTSLRTAFRVTMAGQYFNSITPFAAGGQPFQVYYLMKDGIPMGRCANIIMVKSVLFELCVFSISVVSFIFGAGALNRIIGKFTIFFIVGVTINLAVIAFFGLFLLNKNAARKVVDWGFNFLGKLRIVKDPSRYTKRKEEELAGFCDGSELILHDRGVILKASFYQILNLVLQYAIPWFMLVSMEGTTKFFFEIIASQAVLREVTAYVPSPGAAGGAEGIGYFFFRNFFVSSPIVSVILIWRIFTYYLNLIVGGVSLVFIKSNDKKESGIIEQRKIAKVKKPAA